MDLFLNRCYWIGLQLWWQLYLSLCKFVFACLLACLFVCLFVFLLSFLTPFFSITSCLCLPPFYSFILRFLISLYTLTFSLCLILFTFLCFSFISLPFVLFSWFLFCLGLCLYLFVSSFHAICYGCVSMTRHICPCHHTARHKPLYQAHDGEVSPRLSWMSLIPVKHKPHVGPVI